LTGAPRRRYARARDRTLQQGPGAVADTATRDDDPTARLAAMASGDKAALARALARLERAPEAADTLALLDAAYQAPKGQVVGVTGPPGVGKSTLMGALIRSLRARGRSVGVIAVDPSSKRSGGALLGDRVRLLSDPDDSGIFVRSMAARDRLGGLAELTVAGMVLMRAVYDVVLIETVGVGQSETDVAGVADTVLFCVQPGSGDSLQFMKAGIVEIPDVAAITKADTGAPAERALSDLKGALSLNEDEDDTAWQARCLKLSAETGEGLDELIAALDAHHTWLGQHGRLAAHRARQAEQWLIEALRDRHGREGLKRLGKVTLGEGESPFSRLSELAAKL
jgi:LAO/AO transport system kinase